MDIHKPKPVHGLRELLSEVGVIVIGIVIALVLDEAVRGLHDRSTARDAREAVQAEIGQNLAFMSGRLASQACIERRLDEIGDILEKSGDGKLTSQPRWIGQPAIYFLSDQRWQAATGSGRISLLNADEQGKLGGLYVISARFNEAEAREQAAWALLRGLETWAGPLGPVARVHFGAALQQARYELWETRITIGVAFSRADALGVKHPPPQTMAKGYEVPHAVCLPIMTPRDQALAILSKEGTPPWGQPK
jgi:hypothetical protein